MRHIYVTILSLIFICSQSAAQTVSTIKGSLRFSNDSTVKFDAVTIALLRAKDSAVLKLSLADKEGHYNFEKVKPGKYLVAASAVAYRKVYTQRFDVGGIDHVIELPMLDMMVAPKSLSAVTVTAKKSLIEHRIDRTIVNVDASLSNLGTSAMEVLEKAPGITIDNEGNISLKGKDGVMVMIDGRPTQLSSADLAAMLRNMNAAQLDQLEIMTNPPARYDAAGNAGIINIKTKKNTAAGYNGSLNLSYGQGRYPKTSEGFNVNYKAGKVNLFANLSHSYRKGFETLNIQRAILDPGNNTPINYFDQRANKKMHGQSFNGKIGLDYSLSKKSTIGLVFNGASSPSSVQNRNDNNIMDATKQPEQTTSAIVKNNSDVKTFAANLNFRKQVDAKGKEFSAEVDYIGFKGLNNQSMQNAYFDDAGNSIAKTDTLLGRLPQTLKIYSGRVDYVLPLKKGLKFETGLKSSYVKTDNDAVYDSVEFGVLVRDVARSNHFVYEENINAAYANLSGPINKKFSAQLGLRVENTNATGKQLTTGQTFDRHYTQLFPTAYIQYKADAKNNFGFNYGRRIRRPNYQSLNPFIRFIDRYTYGEGNPNLKPQFSNNLELSHAYKNIITTTLNYTSTTDIIQTVLEQKGEEAYSRPANIASLKQFGIAVSVNTPFKKWWSGNVYVNFFNNRFEGIVNNAAISFSAPGLNLTATQQFKLTSTVSAELSGMYRSSRVEGVFKIRPLGMITAGISKQVLKNNGTIRLTVRDVFYTMRQSAVIKYGNVDAAFQQAGDTRVLNIGFSYRFSKGKATAQKKRPTGSAGDEQERIDID